MSYLFDFAAVFSAMEPRKDRTLSGDRSVFGRDADHLSDRWIWGLPLTPHPHVGTPVSRCSNQAEQTESVMEAPFSAARKRPKVTKVTRDPRLPKTWTRTSPTRGRRRISGAVRSFRARSKYVRLCSTK